MGHGVALLILGFVGLLFFLWPNAMPHIARGIIVLVLGVIALGVAGVGWLLYVEIGKSKALQIQYACTTKGRFQKVGEPPPQVDVAVCRRAVCNAVGWHKDLEPYRQKCAGREPW